jgi:hypothetical protein
MNSWRAEICCPPCNALCRVLQEGRNFRQEFVISRMRCEGMRNFVANPLPTAREVRTSRDAEGCAGRTEAEQHQSSEPSGEKSLVERGRDLRMTEALRPGLTVLETAGALQVLF